MTKKPTKTFKLNPKHRPSNTHNKPLEYRQDGKAAKPRGPIKHG